MFEHHRQDAPGFPASGPLAAVLVRPDGPLQRILIMKYISNKEKVFSIKQKSRPEGKWMHRHSK